MHFFAKLVEIYLIIREDVGLTLFDPKEGYVRICTFWRNLSKSNSPFAKASTSDFFARMIRTVGEEKPLSR